MDHVLGVGNVLTENYFKPDWNILGLQHMES